MAYNSTYSGSEVQALLDEENRKKGEVVVNTLASLPTSKRCITANLSSATAISLAVPMTAGQELYITCIPTATFTQPLPNASPFFSADGSSIDVKSGVRFDISIYCYSSGYYSIKTITYTS